MREINFLLAAWCYVLGQVTGRHWYSVLLFAAGLVLGKLIWWLVKKSLRLEDMSK